MTTAMRLDPHPPAIFMYYLGLAHFNLEKFEAAATSLESATALSPDDQFPFLLLGATYGYLGRKEEAESAIARANELAVQQGYFPVTISTAGRIYLFQLPDRQRFRTGLRLAGVPDFLSEGSFATENRLTMDEFRHYSWVTDCTGVISTLVPNGTCPPLQMEPSPRLAPGSRSTKVRFSSTAIAYALVGRTATNFAASCCGTPVGRGQS